MKSIVKRLCVLLSAFLLAGSFTLMGCRGDTTQQIDTSKTQLYVSNYNGGFGHAWLDALIEEFEEQYKDYEGADGKVGVEIIVDNNKDTGSGYEDTVANSENEIFIGEAVDYKKLANNNIALDITDIVTELNTDGKTIESKMTAEQQAFYKTNEAYFGLPHYFGSSGITYNKDIFRDYTLYFAKGGAPSEYSEYTKTHNDDPAEGTFEFYSYTNGNDPDDLSAGPDGLYGTYDDGLPATYEEFLACMDNMLVMRVTPLIWTGTNEVTYLNFIAAALTADFEGKEQIQNYMDFEGTATHLVDSIDGQGNVTLKAATPLNVQNGYIMYSSAGRYYAAQFLSYIFAKEDYSALNRHGNTSSTHTGAQMEFLRSSQGFYTDQPIAMLLEGFWWENESYDYGTYDKIVQAGGQTREEINVAYMPLPKPNEDYIGQKITMLDIMRTCFFIKSNISEEKIEIAKEFVKFCYTDEHLRQFNVLTNTPHALQYELTLEEEAQLSNFGKSVYNMFKNADKAYSIGSTPIAVTYGTQFLVNNSFSTVTYKSLSAALRAGATPVDIFNNIVNAHTQEVWEQTYGSLWQN